MRTVRSSGFAGRIIAVSSHDAGNEALVRAGCNSACGKLRFDAIPLSTDLGGSSGERVRDTRCFFPGQFRLFLPERLCEQAGFFGGSGCDTGDMPWDIAVVTWGTGWTAGHEAPSRGAGTRAAVPRAMGLGLRRWVMAGVVLAATGCSSVVETGSGGSGGGGEGSGSSDDLARLAAAICERQAACDCDQPDSGFDEVDCETLHYEGLQNYGAAAAENADNYVFDPECLSELVDCWEQLECGQSYADAAACAPSCAVHQMNLGVGNDCYDSWVVVNPPGLLERCEPGLTCLGGHGYAVCDTDAPLQLGERCFDAGMHRHCAPDLYCAGQESGSGECQSRLDEGSACEARDACGVGLRCHEGTCGPLGVPGDECSLDSDCDGDLRCHPIDGVCAAKAKIGETCRFPTEFGVEFLACVDGAWCGEEVCEPPLEIGSPCEFSDGCPTGSACINGSCTDCAEGGCAGGYPLCSAIPHPSMYPTAPE